MTDPIRTAASAQSQGELVCSCPSGDGSLRWPCRAHPQPAPAAQPAEALRELEEVAAFLDGSGPMEGWWFGDYDTPRYWWRAPLRAAVVKVRAALAAPAAPQVQPAAQPVAEWQASANNGKTWRKIDPTGTEHTVDQRVDYLRTIKRGDGSPAYLIRALYERPAAPAHQPLTDEQIDRHSMMAVEAPPTSIVMLVSSIKRLRAHGIGAGQESKL